MRFTNIPIAIAVLSLVCTAALAAASAADALLVKGDDRLEKDQITQAIECYRSAVKEMPNNSTAHQRLGHALSLAGDLQQGAEEERQALNLNQDNADAHCNLGWIFGMEQKFRAAIEEEKLAIALDPSKAFAYSILGLSLASLEDYDLAISAFDKAIELDPQDVNSYLNLAAALGRKKDYAAAISMYKRAIALDRANALAYLGLGAALGKVGDLKGQVGAYQQAVALVPNNPANHGRLGWALSQAGDWRASFREGAVANGLRMKNSGTQFFKMFLTVWAAIFVLFGVLFAVIFSGSRFKPQPGESVVKSFFLTFYKDKPGRFVLTSRRVVFVPEAFSQWFGSTRVSIELDQVDEVQSHSTMSGGRLSLLSANGSVHQFSMPNLVLEPLTKQLKALALAQEQAQAEETKLAAPNGKNGSGTLEAIGAADLPGSTPSALDDSSEIDDADAVIITVVAHESESPNVTADDATKVAAPHPTSIIRDEEISPDKEAETPDSNSTPDDLDKLKSGGSA